MNHRQRSLQHLQAFASRSARPGDRATPLEDILVERVGDRFENMRFGGGGPVTRVTIGG